MNTQPSSAPLIARLEQQLADAGLQVTVESSDGALVLTGIVDTEEARQAAEDIVSQTAPDARIDNQLDVETLLPTNLDDFVSDEPTAELAGSTEEIEHLGGELEPDFSRRQVADPVEIVGPDSDGPDDIAQSGEVYTPPIDPVVTTDSHGNAQVLGGFDSEDDDAVERSSDGRIGDEALAEAVRRELKEDAATTDLTIYVAVRNGVAHLRGEVADLDDADNAETVAARVPGIRDVVEELDVTNV